eukprot:COSAG02_NODE_7427_length_3020_cov_1.982198_2_plen_47_part_00
MHYKVPPAPCTPREAPRVGCARADRDGPLRNTFSERTIAVRGSWGW